MSMPDPETAFAHLANNVHNGLIFEKFAAATGFVPQNEKQAHDLLETAEMLFAMHQQGQIKTASEAYDPISNAKDALLSVLGHSKTASAPVSAPSDLAAALMQNPAIYDSVVSLKAAEAMELQAALHNQ